MKYSRFLSTGSFLPEKILTNEEISQFLDTTDEWITDRVGIKRRHIASENETTSSLAYEAAKAAIANANINPEAIGMIIVATCTPDMFFPSTACLVQERLGIRSACPAFDVSAACAGFNYALSIADQYVRSGSVEYALVIGAEVMSRILDWKDRGTCVLFGDGAGAIVLQASDEPGILSTHLHADGQYSELLYTPNNVAAKSKHKYLMMQGREVFKVAVNSLGSAVEETLKANNMDDSQLDWLIPHQANLRIIKAVAKKLHLSMDKVIITLDEQGNTSAASVPLALDKAVREGKVKRGDMLLLESFGGGFAWGSALVKF